jgi:serine/threonine protein kinase
MKSLDHPNILRLLGVCYSNDGVPSLVLPFMQFADLRSYVADPYRVRKKRISLFHFFYFSKYV